MHWKSFFYFIRNWGVNIVDDDQILILLWVENNTWIKFWRATPQTVEKSYRWIKPLFTALCSHFRVKDGWEIADIYWSRKKWLYFFSHWGITWGTGGQTQINHSLQTIHFYFHEALQAMLKSSKKMVVPALYEQNPNFIQNHRRRRRMFNSQMLLC